MARRSRPNSTAGKGVQGALVTVHMLCAGRRRVISSGQDPWLCLQGSDPKCSHPGSKVSAPGSRGSASGSAGRPHLRSIVIVTVTAIFHACCTVCRLPCSQRIAVALQVVDDPAQCPQLAARLHGRQQLRRLPACRSGDVGKQRQVVCCHGELAPPALPPEPLYVELFVLV